MSKAAIVFFNYQFSSSLCVDFYKRINMFFLPGIEKQFFFIASDGKDLERRNSNFVKIKRKILNPKIREAYKVNEIIEIKEKLSEYEYLFVFDEGAFPLSLIFLKELINEDQYLNFCIPTKINKEKREISTHFYGGKTSSVLSMAQEIRDSVSKDLSKEVIYPKEKYFLDFFEKKKDFFSLLHPGYSLRDSRFDLDWSKFENKLACFSTDLRKDRL